MKHTIFLRLLWPALLLTGCERALLTEPPSVPLDNEAASTGAVMLVSEAIFPLFPSVRLSPYGYLESYFYEDIVIPKGEFTIDFRVEGTVQFWNSWGIYRSLVDEFGPGGATGNANWYYLSRGDGSTSLYWSPSRGHGAVYGPGDADRGANPIYTTSFQVRGPGVMYVHRVPLRVGLGFGGHVTGEQRFTIRATPVEQASVRLTCSGDLGPNSVTRGAEVVCTAAKDPADAAGAITVTQWSFDGAARGDGDLQSLEWRGIMVRSGTVQVKGKVGTGTEQTATATIQVSDRAWPDAPVMHMLELGATGGEDRVPALPSKISWASNLGVFRAFPEPPPGEQLDDPIADVRGGPNDGLYYFVDLTFPIWGRIRINDAAMSRGSGFYEAQERNSSGGGTRIGGQQWCTNRVVTSVLPDLVKAHERRHAEVYRQKYGEVVRASLPELERMTGTYSELADRYEPLRDEADDLAIDASWAIHELRGNPNRVTPSDNGRECNLKNEDGALLENPSNPEGER